MRLADFKLRPDEFVTIKLPHWVLPVQARVMEQKPWHCQLHGEYIEDVILFRKYKAGGKPGSMFELPLSSQVEIIRHGKQQP